MVKMRSDDNSGDSNLVRRSKQGDTMAFGELVNKYKKRIYFTAYHMTHNHSDADDLSQEAFLRAYRAINGFNEKSSFYTWIYRIVVNVSINYLKKKSRYADLPLDERIAVDSSADRGTAHTHVESPRQHLENKEAEEKITSAIDSLPLAQKTVIILVCLEHLSHKEAGEILHCPEKTISWRLYQARLRLKERLGDVRGGKENEYALSKN